MKTYQPSQRTKGLFVLLAFSVVVGCSTEKGAKKEALFEKWSTVAKESPGHSPTPRSHIIIYPEAKTPEGAGEAKEG